MRLMREQDPRFLGLERKIGLFIILAAMAVALLVVSIGIEKDVFTRKTLIYLHSDSGSGFTKGQPVLFKGFKIGKISDVRLTDMGVVEVELEIADKHMKWLRADSRARVEKEMLIGDSVIAITPGSAHMPQLEDGSIIAFDREREIEELAKNVLGEARDVVRGIHEIIVYFNDPKGDFKTMMASLNRLSRDLETTRGNMDRALLGIGDASHTIAQDVDALASDIQTKTLPALTSLIEELDRRAKETEAITTSLGGELPALISNADAAISDLRAVLGEARTAAPLLPDALEQGTETMREAEGFMKTLRGHWLLGGGGTPEDGSRPLEVDSHDANSP